MPASVARRSAACALAALALVGCGGGGGGNPAPDGGLGGAQSDSGDASVARAWADAVREGDYDAANALFAIPATIANGGPRVRVTERAGINEFNHSLPCGAKVIDTQVAGGGYLRATFELVPGADGTFCEGAAEVSFRIVDGHITEWLREATGPPPGTSES